MRKNKESRETLLDRLLAGRKRHKLHPLFYDVCLRNIYINQIYKYNELVLNTCIVQSFPINSSCVRVQRNCVNILHSNLVTKSVGDVNGFSDLDKG